MAFSPILTSQPISYVRYNGYFRNAARETLANGEPVYFTPHDLPATGNNYGFGGPRYASPQYYGGSWHYYYYDNSPSPDNSYNGNCTWWCCGRLRETTGRNIQDYIGGTGVAPRASNWYGNYSGSKDTNANNINPGDIICMTDGGDGHVMFVEDVVGSTIYISQSAYSQRSIWNGMACLVTSFDKSEIYAGASIDMYKGLGSAYYETVQGVIHTGDAPAPQITPSISITPSSYSVTMSETEDYVDFTFDIVIDGIPGGEIAAGGNTYPGLTRIANTGWSYTDYTVSGYTYRRAVKSQTLRYTRESDQAYNITKYMYFNKTFSNGSISSTTPMAINVAKKKVPGILFLEWDGGYGQILS